MASICARSREFFGLIRLNERATRLRELPDPPGSLLLRLFITIPKTSKNSVLPWRGSSRPVRILCSIVGWTIFFLLLLALAMDITDLFMGAYNPSSYGKANRIITMISYCGTQFTLFEACTAAFFLLMKREDIIECAKILESLIRTSDMAGVQDGITLKVRAHLVRQKYYFFAVVLLGCIVVLSPLFEPLFFNKFWDPFPYTVFHFPFGLMNLYSRFHTLMKILVSYPAKSLFAHLSSFLLGVFESFLEKNERFLHALEEKNSPVTHDLYVSHLRMMHHQNEKIDLAFDQLQKTFNLKLLLDVMCNLVGLCIDVSWLSIWIIHPGLGTFASVNWSLVRHVVILVINLVSVWIVVSKPISLFFLVSFNKI
jgi:hypothetical protein